MKRLPSWFKKYQSKLKARSLAERLDGFVPNSICEEARCPNRD